MNRRIIAAMAAALVATLHVAAQQWIQTAVSASDRPLLIWSSAAEASAENDYMLCDVSRFGRSPSASPVRFLRADGTVEFLQRLYGNRLVVRHTNRGRCEIVILDLGRGTRQCILSGERVEYLGMAETDVAGAEFAMLPDDFFAGGLPEAVPFRRFIEVLRFHEYRSGATSAIKRNIGVLNTGQINEMEDDLITPQGFGVQRELTVEISPSGKYSATSFPTYMGAGLRISEIATKRCIFERKDIDISVSPYSSDLPNLAFKWIDDQHLRYSETQNRRQSQTSGLGRVFVHVDIDVTTGQRVRERVFASMWLLHYVGSKNVDDGNWWPDADANPFGQRTHKLSRPPEVAPRRRIGPFELEGRRLFYLGESNPILDGPAIENAADRPLPFFSNDGDFAVDVRASEGGHEFVLIGDRGSKPLVLSKKPCRNLKWL